MRPTLIIARNFLRQMRWILLIYPLVAIAFAVTLVMANDRIARDDLDFYFVQQFVYAIGIATFLAGQANYNERKSRRILGVLSKGIERRDYLAGLLGGVFASSAVFLAGVLLGALFMAAHGQFQIPPVFAAVVLMWFSCCLSAAFAMFLSTFLHPLLAVAGTFFLIGSGVAAQIIRISAGMWFPVYQLNLEARQLLVGKSAHVLVVPIAITEIFIFWLLAGLIFNRRDIAVAIE